MVGTYMENNNTQIVQDAAAQPVLISPDKLLDALYFFWDAFERSTMDFFPVRDTAKQIIAGQDLVGDRLTLGIRRLEWNGGQQRIFKAYMEHENLAPTKGSTKDCLVFDYKGVPVHLYLYEDNPCLSSFDVAFYKYETFNIPNPYDRFSKEFEL